MSFIDQTHTHTQTVKIYNIHKCIDFTYFWFSGTIMCIRVCVCMGHCVLWVAIRIIFSIFEAVSDCLKGFSLSILGQRPYKELCPCKSGWRYKAGSSGWQGPRTLVIQGPGSRVLSVEARMQRLPVKLWMQGRTVKFKTQGREGCWAVRRQHGVRIARLSSEDDDQAFLVEFLR